MLYIRQRETERNLLLEPWIIKRPIIFSVVVWPVVLLDNRFFKAKLDRTRHAVEKDQ